MIVKYTPHDIPQFPIELQLFNKLKSRLSFSQEEKHHYYSLQKGYLGEVQFHNLLNKLLPVSAIPLFSLRFNHRHSEFQIDSLVLFNKSIYLFEVKNYEGDFFLKGNTWYVSSTNQEINNPLIQLKRSESLLRQMIGQAGYDYSIKSFVIFINSKFSLFQAPLNLPIIFSSQLQRFFRDINENEAPVTKREHTLAKHLVTLNKQDSIFEKLPSYTYDELKKGFVCSTCRVFMDRLHLAKLICRQCKNDVKIEKAVLQNIAELLFLFPEAEIKRELIYDWCGKMISKKTIWKILSKNFTLIKNGKYSYYINK